jgi:hypothetical protein
MSEQRKLTQASVDAGVWGMLLGLMPLIWAHSRTEFSGWDLNGSGSVTISDIIIYSGRFLSAGWSWLRVVMPGPFDFFELPEYQSPTILTSITGGALLFSAAIVLAFFGAMTVAVVWEDLETRRRSASED